MTGTLQRRLAAALLGVTLAAAAAAPARAAFDGAPLALRTLEGRPATLSDFGGRTTVVMFWAPWCAMCHVQLPKLRTIYEAAGARRLRVITVAFYDEPEAVRRYVAAHAADFPFPVYYDPGNRAARRMQVTGVPTLFLYDRDGRLVRKTWLTDDPAFLRDLDRLVGGGP